MPRPIAPSDRQRAFSAAPPSAFGEKRILLYRVDFNDVPGAAISSNAAVTLINDLNSYYRQMSYGQMGFAPVGAGSVVTDTLRLPGLSVDYNVNAISNFVYMIDTVRQVASNAGYDPASFDFDIVCTGPKPAMPFGAMAYVGGPGVWAGNNNFNFGVVGHELGHNLGLPHASSWFTYDQSAIGPGILQEFGDIFDGMGVPGSHFNARFKSFLHWIPDADVLNITASGTYQITTQDDPAATGVRALRIPRHSSQSYWVEFRQANISNNRWLTNGVLLRWADANPATNTLLLDTAPGTPTSGWQDSPLLIGRTFSDRCVDLHITPVRKLGTVPESVEVVVNRGPFPENLPPQMVLSASATNSTVGALVTFQADATDPNGDPLVYAWDFGDNNFAGGPASLQYAWTRDGEYVVRCRATDMKGGTASASTVVRVGTASTFLIQGRITKDGMPVEGALVKTPSRFGYSDSDGTYRIGRVNNGRQVMTALFEQHNLFPTGFENPVTVGPNASGIDFVAIPSSLNALTLVPSNAVWNYLDSGVEPSSAWNTLEFDDGSWLSGPAALGYGFGTEATRLGFATNASDQNLTVWFRHPFSVEDVSVINHLQCGLRRAHGVVIYLNGVELFRENMPPGPVLPSTPALSDIPSTEEPLFYKRILPPQALRPGTNLLTAEVHLFSSNTVNMSFALELVALSTNPDALRPRLSLQQNGPDAFVAWPASYTGWSLYRTPDLSAPGSWQPISGGLNLSNGWYTVPHSSTQPALFYRLRKQEFCPFMPTN